MTGEEFVTMMSEPWVCCGGVVLPSWPWVWVCPDCGTVHVAQPSGN